MPKTAAKRRTRAPEATREKLLKAAFEEFYVDAKKVATFIVAAVEGSYGLAKSAQSGPMVRANLELLGMFLEGLRAPGRAG